MWMRVNSLESQRFNCVTLEEATNEENISLLVGMIRSCLKLRSRQSPRLWNPNIYSVNLLCNKIPLIVKVADSQSLSISKLGSMLFFKRIL